MIRSSFFCLGFIFCVSSFAQNSTTFHSAFEGEFFNVVDNRLGQLLMADQSVSKAEYQLYKNKLDEYIAGFEDKLHKYKTRQSLVSAIFYKTHRKWLKRYQSLTAFGQMLKTGNYDCLSATTLYSYLFDELGIDHQIVETRYHIYITIPTEDGEFLIETTDPIYGLVTDQKEVAERLASFEVKNNQVMQDAYTFSSMMNEPISGLELVGLQYYNASVHAYNQQDYANAIDLLLKAVVFRTSARNNEFGLLIAQTVLNDEKLTDQMKFQYIGKVQRLLQGNVTIASR